ncbi:unknown protein [Seminavis robusta]|uniref:Uncharacterized protein n=1 Tax=Seminavis robusta TaxID=568900 RepID=A0A9N8DY05_9STRA|nr:unknown protein [Seminavis robusta]|eukprot:Sro441_g143690.1 n/a (288) ;mRNA; r:38214-39077
MSSLYGIDADGSHGYRECIVSWEQEEQATSNVPYVQPDDDLPPKESIPAEATVSHKGNTLFLPSIFMKEACKEPKSNGGSSRKNKAGISGSHRVPNFPTDDLMIPMETQWHQINDDYLVVHEECSDSDYEGADDHLVELVRCDAEWRSTKWALRTNKKVLTPTLPGELIDQTSTNPNGPRNQPETPKGIPFFQLQAHIQAKCQGWKPESYEQQGCATSTTEPNPKRTKRRGNKKVQQFSRRMKFQMRPSSFPNSPLPPRYVLKQTRREEGNNSGQRNPEETAPTNLI